LNCDNQTASLITQMWLAEEYGVCAVVTCPGARQYWQSVKGKGKGVCKLFMEIHLTTTECHLPYGITQCYLTPYTSEHTPPLPQPDRLVLYLPTI